MNTEQGFAIWITGIPASGKSSITRELVKKLARTGVSVVVLESDEMRKILTPVPTYDQKERDAFYRALALIGGLITRSGMPVIFDATANKRVYREYARTLIPRFVEAYVTCPLETCMNRDPKGIYGRALAGKTGTVPGIQATYEPPDKPEIQLNGRNPPELSADAVMDMLKRLLHI
ncbi:MAG: adenylyl-sulfate kinase [Nitrospirae bacterium]|nr:adenylyl-sulfate kinase [Nitrospirota bacterium]